mmetsp:Transcript_15254/g.19650  ORF Transcript_15254/g.19650 Transcript_15254/m.19650 type:complete len:507 (-) Transcript_15254:83-1603(-)
MFSRLKPTRISYLVLRSNYSLKKNIRCKQYTVIKMDSIAHRTRSRIHKGSSSNNLMEVDEVETKGDPVVENLPNKEKENMKNKKRKTPIKTKSVAANEMDVKSDVSDESVSKRHKINLEEYFKGGSKATPCQRKTVINHMNKKLEMMYNEMIELENVNMAEPNRAGKVWAYKKTLSVIRAWPVEIKHAYQVDVLKNVDAFGPSSERYVKEALEEMEMGREPTCAKLRALRSNSMLRTLVRFESVFGIGPKRAYELYMQGCRDLVDVQRHLKDSDALTFSQKFIEHYDDLTKEVTMKDADTIMNKYLGPILDKYGLKYEVVGGYRRGKEHGAHDIDVLITKEFPKERKNEPVKVVSPEEWSHHHTEEDMTVYAEHVVKDLEPYVISTDKTSFAERKSKHEISHLLCRFDGVVRRLDLVFCPSYQWPFQLLGWTGTQEFEISIRHYAKHFQDKWVKSFPGSHWKLSQHNLCLEIPGRHGPVRYADCRTEEDIFRFLGLEYRPPIERNA